MHYCSVGRKPSLHTCLQSNDTSSIHTQYIHSTTVPTVYYSLSMGSVLHGARCRLSSTQWNLEFRLLKNHVIARLARRAIGRTVVYWVYYKYCIYCTWHCTNGTPIRSLYHTSLLVSRRTSHCVSFCPLAHHPIFPPAIMSAEEVANAFVPHYYQLLDSNPDNLVQLFVSTQCTV